MKIITKTIQLPKFKNNPQRRAYVVNNKTDDFMVVKNIIVRKNPAQNNRVEVILEMPEPESIEKILFKKENDPIPVNGITTEAQKESTQS